MDRVNELYSIAEENGVEVYNFPLPLTGSLSEEIDGHCCIGMDSTRHFIPEDKLMAMLEAGMDACEIAEELDTTEEYVRRAYYYYKDVRGGVFH